MTPVLEVPDTGRRAAIIKVRRTVEAKALPAGGQIASLSGEVRGITIKTGTWKS